MATVLSDEEVNKLEKGSSTGYALSKMSALDLIATVRTREAELTPLRTAIYDVVVSTPYGKSFILTTSRLKDILQADFEANEEHEKAVADVLKSRDIAQASREFLNAYRAHHVFDRVEPHSVTATRLIEAEERLIKLLEDDGK